jgi:hypothetical protein
MEAFFVARALYCYVFVLVSGAVFDDVVGIIDLGKTEDYLLEHLFLSCNT